MALWRASFPMSNCITQKGQMGVAREGETTKQHQRRTVSDWRGTVKEIEGALGHPLRYQFRN